MPKHAFAQVETEELIFRRPRMYLWAGIITALIFLVLGLIGHYANHLGASTPDPYPALTESNRHMEKFMDWMFATLGLFSLYLGSPYGFRFDFRRGTYEIREGWFPFRWTTRGTLADIDSIYVGWIITACTPTYDVRIRWKRGGWRWRGSSMIIWDLNLADAEEKASANAQILGVPQGPTAAPPRRRGCG